MKQHDINKIIDKIPSMDSYLYDINYQLPSLSSIVAITIVVLLAYVALRISIKNLKHKNKAKRKNKEKTSSTKSGKKKEEKDKYREKKEREEEHVLKRIKMFIDKMMEKDRAKSITDSLPNLPELSRRQERTQERSEERERTQERDRTQEKGRERDGPDRQNPDAQRTERPNQQMNPNIITPQDKPTQSKPETHRPSESHHHKDTDHTRRPEHRHINFMSDLRYSILPRLDLNPISNIVNLMAGKVMPMQDLLKVPTPLNVTPSTNPVLRPEHHSPQQARAANPEQQAPRSPNSQHAANPGHKHPAAQPQQSAKNPDAPRDPHNIAHQIIGFRFSVIPEVHHLLPVMRNGAIGILHVVEPARVVKELFIVSTRQADAPQQEQQQQR